VNDWLSVDATTYGEIGLSLFVFDAESNDERAAAVTPLLTG
jgi:hypothetical protein